MRYGKTDLQSVQSVPVCVTQHFLNFIILLQRQNTSSIRTYYEHQPQQTTGHSNIHRSNNVISVKDDDSEIKYTNTFVPWKHSVCVVFLSTSFFLFTSL